MTQATAPSPTESRPPGLDRTEPLEAVEIRDILFPSDLSSESGRALDHAALLAKRFSAQVTLYHVVRTGDLGEARDPDDPQFEARRREEKAARAQLERRLGELPPGSEVLVDQDASVHRALLRRIAARKPDLVVMATHGRDGLASLVLGSTAEMVVQFGRSPVLCVREPEHGAALPYRRILVPTDLSHASRRAFGIAAELARGFDAEVVALHATRLLRRSAPTPTAEVLEAVDEQVPGEEQLRAFLMPEFLGLRVLPRVEIGSAWDRITETARLERADVIVMSTHGRDSLADRVIGSHTDRVIRHAPCPVLVV